MSKDAIPRSSLVSLSGSGLGPSALDPSHTGQSILFDDLKKNFFTSDNDRYASKRSALPRAVHTALQRQKAETGARQRMMARKLEDVMSAFVRGTKDMCTDLLKGYHSAAAGHGEYLALEPLVRESLSMPPSSGDGSKHPDPKKKIAGLEKALP